MIQFFHKHAKHTSTNDGESCGRTEGKHRKLRIGRIEDKKDQMRENNKT